ncbi:OmpA/MotB family protein [Flexithrix dorotheae]|uniref:OmpA/MotB family protein n=1 Tax=Flexithrix dorotheae TaxID=70993 RepID=UPI0012FA724E|nr:OmpA family protein [Flexithrix dorotheae]
MKKSLIFTIVTGFTFLFSGCVSKKVYEAQVTESVSLKQENRRMAERLDSLDLANHGLQTQVTALTEYASNKAIDHMNEKLEKEKEVNRLRSMLLEQKTRLQGLKWTISTLLLPYQEISNSTFIKDGMLYISLDERLLFPSNKANLNGSGKKALDAILPTLFAANDLNIMVVGHTDNLPVINGPYKDNWELSTARANAVVRYLMEKSKINPGRITTAGKSFHDPITQNNTVEGRRANRRTEIVLMPKMNEVLDLL